MVLYIHDKRYKHFFRRYPKLKSFIALGIRSMTEIEELPAYLITATAMRWSMAK
jgi:hypothetical protein